MADHFPQLEKLLRQNRNWAERIKQDKPEFFRDLARQQSPSFLWIGCSDSRVPATQIVDMVPGEIFVHRNIANVVLPGDLNSLSVLQYAVEVLKVRHIIVCGHYGCGGIATAMEEEQHGLIDNWLGPVRDLYHAHYHDLLSLPSVDERSDRMCELNVEEQVRNVCRSTVVREAWKRGQELDVHGWIYHIEDGIIRDLDISSGPGSDQAE